MGQTLTHGVYLPDEGERNCYSGLAANWQILDTSVGTIAAHTAALAGKAPLVHTHTVSQITDFPAYGNAAGTICEGNDSRLSDARTPVAHTHTKSDVTDLFNSANVWTENNTYAKYIFMKNTTVEVGNAPSNNTSKEISFTDKNNMTLSRLVGKAEASGNSYIFLHATNKYTNEALDPNGSARHSYFYVGLDATGKAYNKHAANTFPDANNTYDLGSSSYQWNNLYAKNYYYNGVVWGLDKANTWTGSQTLSSNSFLTVRGYRFRIKNDSMILGTVPSSNQWTGMQFVDKNDNCISEIVQSFQSNGNSLYQINVYPNEANSEKRSVISYAYNSTNNTNNVSFSSNVTPQNSNTYGLGTSTNKWKTLNGVNPGALSLPKTDSSITGIETSGFSFDGTNERIPDTVNIFSNGEALMNGWLCARLAEGAGHYIFLSSDDNIGRYGICSSCFSSGIVTTLSFGINVYVPIKVGDKPAIRWAKPNGGNAQLVFYPCLGNV